MLATTMNAPEKHSPDTQLDALVHAARGGDDAGRD
jgi:hypothetical protein